MNRLTHRRLSGGGLLTGGGLVAWLLLLAMGCAADHQRQEPETSSAVVAGEVPAELLQAMIDDLVADEAVRDVTVERAERVTWSDASLGCPRPGELAAQMLTEGYWVILGAGGERFDYRANTGGHFLRCDQPGRRKPLS